MNNYFKSKEFYTHVAALAVGNREGKIEECYNMLITAAFTYMQLNRNDDKLSLENVDRFLNQSVKVFSDMEATDETSKSAEVSLKNFKDISNKVMAREFAKDKNLENNFEQCNKLIDNQMALATIKFHAFNSANLESIQQNGIDPNLSNPHQPEIDRIHQIFVSHGIDNIFGWQKLNCEKKVYYSETPRVSYSYANRSPEWFSQFVTGGTRSIGDKSIDSRSYMNRDYEASKQNITQIMTRQGFSREEMQEVYQFFDKFWQKYATKEPVMAVMCEVEHDEDFLLYDMFLRGKKPSDCIDFLQGIGYNEIDGFSTEKIDTKQAMYFSIPNAKELERCVKYIQQNQKQEDLTR